MRAILFTLLFGITSMSATEVQAQDPAKKEDYLPNATVRHWDANGKKFLKPIPNLLALKGDKGGKTVIYTRPLANNEQTPKGSEITIGDETWVVERSVEGTPYWTNYVVLKPKDK